MVGGHDYTSLALNLDVSIGCCFFLMDKVPLLELSEVTALLD